MQKLFLGIAALVATSTGIYLIPSVSTVEGATDTYYCSKLSHYHFESEEDKQAIIGYCSRQ